jgi:hypothetical protein
VAVYPLLIPGPGVFPPGASSCFLCRAAPFSFTGLVLLKEQEKIRYFSVVRLFYFQLQVRFLTHLLGRESFSRNIMEGKPDRSGSFQEEL